MDNLVTKPGEIVAVRVWGMIEHVGILTESGSVISNSMKHGRVIEEPLSGFAAGRTILRKGYWSSLPGAKVIRRARSHLDRPWKLVDSNCEHFVRFAHGLNPESPQLARAYIVLMIGILLKLSARS